MTPIAAKFLERIEAIPVAALGPEAAVQLSLPFSWRLFFFAGLATALGNIIYSLACPPIVKEYDSYFEFQAAGRGRVQLQKEWLTLLRRHHGHLGGVGLADNLVYFGTEFCVSPFDAEDIARVRAKTAYAVPLQSKVNLQDARLSDAFWWVRDIADTLLPKVRFFCLLSYSLGLLLASVVMVQNVLFVICSMSGSNHG